MRKLFGYLFFVFVLINFLRFEIVYFLPVLVPLFIFIVIYNVMLRFRPLEVGHPKEQASNQDNTFAAEIKQKFNTSDPYDTIATYDPVLVEIDRFNDLVSTSTMKVRLLNPPKKHRDEETMMFLNEGEQVILEPATSRLSTIAVYDRSKHLLGYIPKNKNNTILQLINQQRIIKGIIISLNKSFFTHTIDIEIEYKNQ